MVTAQQMITDIGYAVDDPNQARFKNTQLLTYINEAASDIARRAEVLLDIQATPVLPNVRDYSAPIDTVRIYKLEFQPANSIQIWPIQHIGIIEADALWGINQYNQSTWPIVYTTWNNPPNILIRLYPVPSQYGNIMIYYYRLPIPCISASSNIDLPLGWEDLVRDYCEYLCKRADHDADWSDAKKIYEDKLAAYIEKSRKWVDGPGQITTGFNPYPWFTFGEVPF